MSGDVQALPWLLHGASFLALGLIGALLPRGVTLPRFADTCRAIARFGLLL